MSSKRHTCNCDYCVDGRNAKKELQFGGTDWETDDEELVPYRKHKGKNWRRKRKACKKSKTGESCDFSVKKVYRTYGHNRERILTDYVMTCSRCGKYGPILWDNGWRF